MSIRRRIIANQPVIVPRTAALHGVECTNLMLLMGLDWTGA